jgi:hypothetical protein
MNKHIKFSHGDIFYIMNGGRHREEGPAIIYQSGTKCWYQNDQLHREDGPAVEFNSGKKYWYYHGEEINCSTQKEFERLIKLKAFW